MSRILIAGIKEIDRDLFCSPNMEKPFMRDMSYLNKPNGCLWGSTLLYNEEYPSDWLRWTAQEDFYLDKYNGTGLSFKLSKKARICTIDSVESYKNLMKKYAKDRDGICILYEKVIDWVKLAQDFDAFHLTKFAFDEMRLARFSSELICEDGSRLCDFYSYDCESWIIFNLDCINWGSVLNHDIKVKSMYGGWL